MEPDASNNKQPLGQPPDNPLTQPTERPAENPAPESAPESTPEAKPIASAEPTTTPEPGMVAESTVTSESTTETASTVVSEPTAETGSAPATQPIAVTAEPSVKKVNKPLIITLVLLLTAAVAAAIIYFLLLPPKGNSGPEGNNGNGNNNGVANNEAFELGAFSDFDLKFLKLANNTTDAIYSPLSIKYALGMLSDAADGDSYTQIHNVIGDFTPKKYVNSEHRSFANAMFIRDEQKERVLSSYKDSISSKYGAEIIYDSFAGVDTINNWVDNKTFGIINNLLSEPLPDGTDYALVNALAIDMNWENQLQCHDPSAKSAVSCKPYSVHPLHENYDDSVSVILSDRFSTEVLNGREIEVADIGVTANRYNIVSELGEDHIRTTVLSAYDKWLEDNKEKIEKYPQDYEKELYLDRYLEELSANYGSLNYSTDFYFNDTDNEKVFAKNLKEYDGSTLQYVAIMPKTESLTSYVSNVSVDKIGGLISGLKNTSQIENFKDGVVTRISANIPFFDFDYKLNLKEDLKTLGITDVFNRGKANLGRLATYKEGSEYNAYVNDAMHKANIDFSNDGIRAAAATIISGGLGAAGPNDFDYKWDVPVEEIDLSFDKPFLFLIRDKASGEIWFAGTFYNTTN